MAPGYIWWIGAMTSLEPLLSPTHGRYLRWTHVLRHSDYTLLLSRVGLMRLEIINLMFGAVGTVVVWVNLNQHRDSWNVSFALSFHMNVEIGGNSIPQSYLWRNYFTLHTSEYILKWLQDIYDELEPWRHWATLHPTLGRYPRWTHVLRHSDYTLLLSRVGLMRLEIINLMFGAVGTVDVWVNLNQHRDSWNVSFALSFHMNVEIGGNSIPPIILMT